MGDPRGLSDSGDPRGLLERGDPRGLSEKVDKRGLSERAKCLSEMNATKGLSDKGDIIVWHSNSRDSRGFSEWGDTKGPF